MLSYLLLTVERKMQEEIKDKLLGYEFTVDRINRGKGRYNLIARVVTNDEECLQSFISEQVDSMSGIKEVKSIII